MHEVTKEAKVAQKFRPAARIAQWRKMSTARLKFSGGSNSHFN